MPKPVVCEHCAAMTDLPDDWKPARFTCPKCGKISEARSVVSLITPKPLSLDGADEPASRPARRRAEPYGAGMFRAAGRMVLSLVGIATTLAALVCVLASLVTQTPQAFVWVGLAGCALLFLRILQVEAHRADDAEDDR